MKIELCDWCGNHKEEGEGATIKIYEHKPHQKYRDRLWGNTYVICQGCLNNLKEGGME